MTGIQPEPPASRLIEETIKRVLPGDGSPRMALRRQILQICLDQSARAVLIQGPIGAGKSVIARLIAYGKDLAVRQLEYSDSAHFRLGLRFDRPGRIDHQLMDFYQEVAVTGFDPSLVRSQLLGIAPGTATGVDPSDGLFERARRGSSLTGGVVFLDEIGDLPEELQAVLLPILSQGVYYPVGGEATKKLKKEYNGIVLAATWKDAQIHMRPDLYSRLAAHVVQVPALDARSDDLEALVSETRDHVVTIHTERIGNLLNQGGPHINTVYWTREQARIQNVQVDTVAIAKLCDVDWATYGNLRALTNVVERIVIGNEEVDDILEGLPQVKSSTRQEENVSETLYANLLRRQNSRDSLSGHVKAIELSARTELKRRLSEPRQCDRLAKHLGVDPKTLVRQMRHLDRSRRAPQEESL